jgi:hypothetical protein
MRSKDSIITASKDGFVKQLGLDLELKKQYFICDSGISCGTPLQNQETLAVSEC